MRNTLFDIEQKYLDLISTLEDNGGELTPELEVELMINEEDFKDKFSTYRNIVAAKEAQVKYLSDEINRLRDKVKVNENVITRMKKLQIASLKLFGELNKSGNKSFSFDTFKASCYPLTTVIEDELEISKLVSLAIDDFYSKSKTSIDLTGYKVEMQLQFSSDNLDKLKQEGIFIEQCRTATARNYKAIFIDPMTINVDVN